MLKVIESTLHMIPANNWWAVYGDCDKVFVDPLVCWALVKRKTDSGIEGMVNAGGYIDTVEDVSNFKDYVYADTEEEALKRARQAVS